MRVHLNCAMSLDGCLGLPGPRPLRLSGPEDLRRVHELRAASDAILVGAGTVLADDPKLTVKWELLGRRTGKNPTRVVLDAKLRTPPGAEILKGDAPTLLFHGRKGGAVPGSAQLATVPVDRHGFLDLKAVLAELERRGLQRLMVEGGATVIGSFLRERLVDEATIYVAPTIVGDPAAPRLAYGEGLDSLGLKAAAAQVLGAGILSRWVRA